MKSMREKTKAQLMLGVFALGVFAFLLVFFLGYHPLTVNNLDDWTYMMFRRPAVPQSTQWNPAKVLPEILMPACAQLAVWLVMPLTGDYITALSIVFNVVFCLFITLYIMMFSRLIMRLTGMDAPVTVLLSALFLVFHFRSWMSPWIPSQHLFFSEGLTTYYNYTVPALLNLMLVMLMDSAADGDALVSPRRAVSRGMLVVLMYLAVFSNLYSSVILAVYCGVSMALALVKALKGKASLRAWLGESVFHIGVLIAWFVSMAFELFGSRAGSMASDAPLRTRIGQTLSILLVELEKMEDTVFWLCVLMIAAGLVLLAISRGRHETDQAYATAMLRYLLCAGLTLLYLILLSAVVAPAYIARKDVLIGAVFYVFAAAFISLAYLIRRWKSVAIAVPLVTFIMAFDVLIGISSFARSNALYLPQKTCMAINRSFVEQVLEADRMGQTRVTIAVPAGNAMLGNWPYTHNMGYRMRDAMAAHGMVKHVRDVVFEVDEQFFETFIAD